MARNRFSALNLESDSEPEFDPELLSRSLLGGEPTIPSHFGVFGLEQQTFEPRTQTPETESILVLKKELKLETKQEQKPRIKWPRKHK